MNPPSRVEAPLEPMLGSRWYAKFKVLLFVVFVFEIGFFLLIFPWLQGWDRTSIPLVLPWLATSGTMHFFGEQSAVWGL